MSGRVAKEEIGGGTYEWSHEFGDEGGYAGGGD